MKYLIGVDGGGTKTEAAAYDLDGHVMSQGMAGFGNLLVNQDQAIAHIVDAIGQCLQPLKREDCAYLYLGLAGYGGLSNTHPLQNALQRSFGLPFTIVNDGLIAHAALLKGEDGILTISGTGSVSIAKFADQVEMAGGWGHLLGDEGSGFWIALEALKKIAIEEDQQRPCSSLTKEILAKLGLNQRMDIKKFVYQSSKGEIAAIVPLIVEQAHFGDAVSQSILHEAGIHLAHLTLAAYHKLPFPELIKIAVKGSVLTKIPFVQKAFLNTIMETLPEAQLILDEVSSTLGCYYLAKKIMK
ncbi:N-acetylglucosamine kinase [Neobacillus niacini]|uniref:N-acetylglucosamine kinase n=1 Tax=Neobacillus niacini TaxID=86668 RepID=UPI0021CB793A|nr:BadF/BadG/BcrA/BcrD ATPase family protein [Neobacillus niacini]MCM3763656.1 ATPase [Neobacillus niacini]